MKPSSKVRYVSHRLDNLPFEPDWEISPFCRMQLIGPDGVPGPFCGATSDHHVAFTHQIGDSGIMVVSESHGMCGHHAGVLADIPKTTILVHPVGEHCGRPESVLWMDYDPDTDGEDEVPNGCQPYTAEPEAVERSDRYVLKGFAAWMERRHAEGGLASDQPVYIGRPEAED